MARRLASQGLAIPNLFMNHLFVAKIAGVVPAHGAFRIEAWVQVNEKVGHAPEMRIKHFFQDFHLAMGFIKREISQLVADDRR